MSRQDDFEVRATATVEVEGEPDPVEVPLTIPIGLLVTRGYEGALEVGSNICPEQRTTTSTGDDPVPFSYLVGNLSLFQYSYLDEEGHTVWFTRPVEVWVDSTPRPDEPCEIRSMQEEPPVVATYTYQALLEIGSVYLVDQCDNLVQRDSWELDLTATLTQSPGGASVEITSNDYQWKHGLALESTPPGQGVPPGGYEVAIEAESTGPCSSGGDVGGTFTATVATNQPQVILWWDPADAHGANPANTLISPASALRDQTGEIAVWRVPAFQSDTFDGHFPGNYVDAAAVPVRLYVTPALAYFDYAGQVIRDQYRAPLEGVELASARWRSRPTTTASSGPTPRCGPPASRLRPRTASSTPSPSPSPRWAIPRRTAKTSGLRAQLLGDNGTGGGHHERTRPTRRLLPGGGAGPGRSAQHPLPQRQRLGDSLVDTGRRVRGVRGGWGGCTLDEQYRPYPSRISVPAARGVFVLATLDANDAKSGSIPVRSSRRMRAASSAGGSRSTWTTSALSSNGAAQYLSAQNDLQLYPSSQEPEPGYEHSVPVAVGGKLTTARLDSELVVALIDTSPIDLDVDSNNNEGVAVPGRKEDGEDDLEAWPFGNSTGKFVFVNHNDDNHNGTPDFADLDNPDEGTFVPMVLELQPDVPWGQVSVWFEYDGLPELPSFDGVPIPDPREAHGGESTGFFNYTGAKTPAAPGGGVLKPALRVWRVASAGAARSASEYIVPGQQYSATDLGFSDSAHERVFYLEGINPTLDGTASAPTLVRAVMAVGEQGYSDEVLVTVVEPNLGVNNSNNRTTLRPGVPDADFVIDQYDEMVEDQRLPDPATGDPRGGFEFWRGRYGAGLADSVADLFPAVVDIPQVLREKGFKAFLRLETDHPDVISVFHNPSPLTNLRSYLSNPDTFDVLASSVEEGTSYVSDEDLLIEPTDERTSLLLRAESNTYVAVDAPAEASVRLDLVLAEPNGRTPGVVVDSVLLTIREIDRMFWVGSARYGDPTDQFVYPTEAHNDGSPGYVEEDIEIYPPFRYESGSEPDPAKTDYVIYVHGYNVTQDAAVANAQRICRRLYWAGYRGNFLALTWHGDEGTFLNFFGDVENAFRTSPDLEEFLRDSMHLWWNADPHHVNLLVHSLGNVVAWDALRLHATHYAEQHPGEAIPPLVHHIVSFEAALWSEALWEEQLVLYQSGRFFTVEELRRGSWAFWFNQAGHPAAAGAEKVVNSFVPGDLILYAMEANDTGNPHQFDRLMRCMLPSPPANQRVPVEDGVDTDDPANRPDLATDIPALPRPDLVSDCIPNIEPEYLVPPLGTVRNPLSGSVSFSPSELGLGWRADKHSDYVEQPLPVIWPWYSYLLNPDLPEIPGGILPRGRE